MLENIILYINKRFFKQTCKYKIEIAYHIILFYLNQIKKLIINGT